MRPMKGRSDPAPSRWRYRLQRLWLTPAFRSLIRIGIPAFAAIGALLWYLSDPVRIAAIVDTWDDTIRTIQDRPEFMVHLTRIEGASEQLREDIEEALPIDLPLSQFALDIDALRTALEDLDPVARAEVRIKAGGVLLLKVTERQPAVAWVN
ncbi:MAG: FtsQ-type POTRA domain-containing protein, partial [Jannaschia sp.]